MSQLATAMGVAPPSVTTMVRRMEKLGLVKRDSASRLELTTCGRGIALEVIRHHRLLETFLIGELGMDWADAHREAEVLEHYISERLEAVLDDRLDRPTNDPHGEPIPTSNGYVSPSHHLPLLQLPVGSIATITQVETQDPELLEYLQQHKLVPNQRLRLLELAPFNGPVVLSIDGTLHYISRDVADCIRTIR